MEQSNSNKRNSGEKKDEPNQQGRDSSVRGTPTAAEKDYAASLKEMGSKDERVESDNVPKFSSPVERSPSSISKLLDTTSITGKVDRKYKEQSLAVNRISSLSPNDVVHREYSDNGNVEAWISEHSPGGDVKQDQVRAAEWVARPNTSLPVSRLTSIEIFGLTELPVSRLRTRSFNSLDLCIETAEVAQKKRPVSRDDNDKKQEAQGVDVDPRYADAMFDKAEVTRHPNAYTKAEKDQADCTFETEQARVEHERSLSTVRSNGEHSKLWRRGLDND